jgi:scyllo-inositol 2-dehydrogenase (NADP+)
MRVTVVGMGVQGTKRVAVAGDDVVATVDPVSSAARYKDIAQVPLGDYDAALVCTPDSAKPELLRYLLGHGKHVLVEKPMSGGVAQIGALEALARSRGVACYTAYNHRFEPHIARLKQVLEAGTLGRVYLARFFYGNGTAADVRRSEWRDRGLGVLPDLGSHLLDMALFLFGAGPLEVPLEVWAFDRFENRSCDHVLFGARGVPVLQMEATLLSWRNTFQLDLYAEHGSAHIHCLCKWGPSSLTVRKRVLPSGKPTEEVLTLESPDPTWALEYEHFKRLCATGGTNLANDVIIARALEQLGRAARPGGEP